MTTVYLALGGNVGDRLAALRTAMERLRAILDVDAVSSVYETPAAYVENQPAFLNMAVGGRTPLSATGLLDRIKRLESDIGRTPSERYGPRLIDVDILFHGDRVVETERLTVPHPLMAERAFVLAPLADIAARLRHPVTRLSVEEMLRALPAESREGVRNLGTLAAATVEADL